MDSHRPLLLLVVSLLLAQGAAWAEKDPALPKDLPPLGQDRPLPVPPISESRTREGLSVMLVRRAGFPKISAILAVHGGTAADPRGKEGISELLAAALKEGTRTRSARQIAEDMEMVGGQIGTSATDDAIVVAVDGLSGGAQQIVGVLADVARNAAFPDKEVSLARDNAISGLAVRESTPEFLGERVLAREVFGSHPYRFVAPTQKVLAAVTPALLRAEYARRFRPERSLLAVVGDFDEAGLVAAIERAFSGWRGSGPPPPPTPSVTPSPERRLVFIHRPGSVQSLILLGRTAPRAGDPEYFPVLLGNTLLAGSFSGRLITNLREDKGYTYSPGGEYTTYEKGGMLQLRCDVRSEVTAPSLLESFYELDRLGVLPVTAEELMRAKRFQRGLYLLRNQVQETLALTLVTAWVNGLPQSALRDFVPKVDAVTAAQVQEAARTYFPSRTQTVVIVGDRERMRDVSQFGKVIEVDMVHSSR